MRVHLPRLRLTVHHDIRVDDFEHLAALDRFHEHGLAAEPDDAEVVLFTQCHMVDWRLKAIREHPAAKRHWAKVMVYDERDRPWLSFPGIYVSMPRKSFNGRCQRPWGYIGISEVDDLFDKPDLLFSFVGSASHPCRQELFKLRNPEAVIEEVHGFMFWDPNSVDFENRRTRYRCLLARSRFVLCPRGRGTSSFRIYEALAAGRVPVIISDDWVAPRGPDWESFSIRWPEGRRAGLVEMLQERDRDWPRLSSAAVKAYQEFFAPDVAFHRIVELCLDLRRSGRAARPSSPAAVRNRSVLAATADAVHSRASFVSNCGAFRQ